MQEIVGAYVEAWDRLDIDGVVEMLTEQATFSMPPQTTWFGGEGGHRELKGFMEAGPLTGDWDWRHRFVYANGQPTLAFYCWYEPDGAWIPFALNVLSFDADSRRISDVTCFITRSLEGTDPEYYGRWPEAPVDQRRLEDFFLRFGLPASLDG